MKVIFHWIRRNDNMPIPTPQKDETKQEFIERCMSDDTMVKEYPNKGQRYAICLTQWRNKNKNKDD